MLEKTVESHFAKKISARGFLTLKFLSTIRGVPDRIVFGAGRCYLVEFKNGPEGRLSKLQEFMFRRFAEHGFPVYVLRTREEVDWFVDRISALRVPTDGHRLDP